MRFLLAGTLLTAAGLVGTAACDTSVCDAGKQSSCVCPDSGLVGTQVCTADGDYGVCECVSSGSGGSSSGDGGAGATGPVTSSGAGAGGSGGDGGAGGSCEDPLVECGDDCVNVQTSDEHCGECENPCPEVAMCVDGACACAGADTLCGDSCVDLDDDEENCGACGHACDEGDACQAGLCPVQELATEVSEPYSVVLGTSAIYWSAAGSDNKVFMADLDGANPVTIASAQNSPRQLAIDTANDLLVWANFGLGDNDAQIMSYDLDAGGDAAVLVSNRPKGVFGVTLAGGFVYWGNQNTSSVNKNPTGQADNMSGVAANQGVPQALAANDTHVYWSNYDAGEIRRAPLGGGVATAIASAQNHPFGVALDDTYVYWTNEEGGELMRAPLAGGMATSLISGLAGPTYLVLADEYLYWTNYTNGSVVRMHVTGGPQTILAVGQAQPYSIAVGADHVYWTTFSGGTVARVAR